MRRDRWRIVERLLDEIHGTAGPLVLAIAPQPLDVVLYEVPVLARKQPPHNPLRGFIQEAALLLGGPTAADIAGLLHLPPVVVELVLGNLQQMGSVTSDVAGQWRVPKGAPVFKSSGEDPPIWRRTRRLLCYWPQRDVLLPVLPRLRLRDLVELGVHQFQGDVRDWYARCAAWTGAEGVRRGLPTGLRLLPLIDPPSAEAVASGVHPPLADSPIAPEDVLVSRCQLDVIVLTWASPRCGVWELTSRIWCRPTPPEKSEGEPFVPGEPVVGLSLPEKLLDTNRLNDLGTLFDPRSEVWQNLLEQQDERLMLGRDLRGESPTLIVAESNNSPEQRRWYGLPTHLGSEARLLCSPATPSRPRNEVGRPDR